MVSATKNENARKGEGTSRLKGILVGCIAAPLLCLSLSTCGLDSIVYYSQPSFSYDGGLLTLNHNTANTEFFLGYDIYYRVYSDVSVADTDRLEIESATSSTTGTPETAIAKMIGLQFKKIYLASAPTIEPTPLLKVDTPTSSTTFNIYMQGSTSSSNWYFTTAADPTQLEIVRGTGTVNSATGLGQSFNSSYSVISDTDYDSTTTAAGSGGTIHFVFFAVAYGYNINKLAAVYSYPTSTYLSDISYSIP